MTGPLISVIIPVYNGERYLAEAIESVLAQTYRPIEIIVVDDGSTDNSAEVARHFADVRYCFQPHSGAGAARNRGVELAKGKYLAFLDADDLWTADKLTRQVSVLEADPELDMVWGRVELFFSPELAGCEIIESVKSAPNGLHVGAMLVRRAAFDRVGSFASHWRVGEFVDWYSRAMELGLQSLVLPDVVMRRRVHANNLTQREREAWVDYTRILKAALERRRMRQAR